MRNLRDSKSGLPLLELLKIPVTWYNFIISIIFFLLFRCLSLFRETPRFLYPVHVIGPKIVVQ